MSRTVNARVQVRRDEERNYRNDFLPLKGELCLVDTVDPVDHHEELKLKIGDGVTLFPNLAWWGNSSKGVLQGYYYNDNFYEDQQHTILIRPNKYSLYIDIPNYALYYYNEVNYVFLTQKVVDATGQVKGIMKLYNSSGQNTDGTITQKKITDMITMSVDQETLVFNQPINN